MSGGWAGSNRRDTLPADWPVRRQKVLRRDGYRCTAPGCGAVATQVDHVVPHWRGGTDDLDNLTSLCESHHAAKSATEGNEAKAWRREAVKRPRPIHPGMLSD